MDVNIGIAMQGLSALIAVIAKYSAVIGRAQAEGRDVTKAELATLETERKAAVDKFLAR